MDQLYHVYIVPKSNNSNSLTKLGLTRQQLIDRVVDRYDAGEPITLSGRSIPANDIEQIRISTGTASVQQLMAQVDAKNRHSSVLVASAGFDEYQAFALCDDVTDEIIHGPPGHRQSKPKGTGAMSSANKVFVVHGHDGALKNAVARFIELLGLKPVILHEQPNRGRTVIEKFEAESDVAFAIVLATGDDLAASVKSLAASNPKVSKADLNARARQNVMFELGFFYGKLGRAKTALVTESGVELPSDLGGIIYTLRTTWQTELLDALTAAGFTFSQPQIVAALAIKE